jgi:hypothetical protein
MSDIKHGPDVGSSQQDKEVGVALTKDRQWYWNSQICYTQL